MGPLWLGTRFRRQPRAHKGAPLRASGVDRSARPSKVAIMPIMRRIASLEGLWKGSVLSGGVLGKALKLGVWGTVQKTLDSVELI
jgi:hypothetical protein